MKKALFLFFSLFFILKMTASDSSHCLLERHGNIATFKVIAGRLSDGWLTLSNNNDFPVRLVNLDRPDAFFDLQNLQSRSVKFKGTNRIGCYVMRQAGIKGQELTPISCEKITVTRCFPYGSPGGQANRYDDLHLSGTRRPLPGVAQSGPPSKLTPTAGMPIPLQ